METLVISTQHIFQIDALPKFNIAPEKLPSQEERIVFQPSFFRGYVKLRGGQHNTYTNDKSLNFFKIDPALEGGWLPPTSK